jgi:hypothetical protein
LIVPEFEKLNELNVANHNKLEQKLVRLYGDMYRRIQSNSQIKQASLASLSHIFCSQF